MPGLLVHAQRGPILAPALKRPRAAPIVLWYRAISCVEKIVSPRFKVLGNGLSGTRWLSFGSLPASMVVLPL